MSTPTSLPEAYESPSTYLDSPKFHQTLLFTPTCLPDEASSPALTVSYALCGSTDPSAPVLLWINGLGHHRLACCLFDELFKQKGIRLLSLERPSSGLSSRIQPDRFQYSHRVRVVYESILKVLEKERISEFSLLSHSNGIIYSLYLLLNLPSSTSTYSCKNWLLTSPWIPPEISGNLPLTLASWLPNSLTSKLGSLVQGFESISGPLSFSHGLAREWIGWSTGYISSSSNSIGTQPNRTSSSNSAREQIESFETLQSLKPLEERTFGGRFYPPGLLEKGMKFAIRESENGLEGMGIEAVMSLNHGTRSSSSSSSSSDVDWGWFQPKDDKEEEEVKGEVYYEKGFENLKRKIESDPGLELNLRVWCAGQDGMIPEKGREWFKKLMVYRLELVREENWKVIQKAGHDEILGLEIVINEILTTVKRA